MRRLPLLLLLVATGAAARTPVAPAPAPAPAPAAPAVPDRDVVRLLSAQYDAKARLRGAWASRADAGSTLGVCADSVAGTGDRYIAVCSFRGPDRAPERVDLFVLEPPATRRGSARIRSRFRGIQGEGAPAAGGVYLMPVAPGRLAFVLGAATTSGGWTRATRSLYAERDDGLRRLLTVGTRVDNTGRCTPGPDRAGRRCAQRVVALRCTLRADTSRVVDGAWPLELRVNGVRHGEAVNRIVPIPHDAYGYRISARVLETQGCDGHG
jgi:hypothetical protein